MDDQTVIFRQRLEHWRATRSPEALSEALGILLEWLPIPQSLAQALGGLAAEDLRMQAIEQLILDPPDSFLRANPRTYVRLVLKNRYRDALREIETRRFKEPQLVRESAGRFHALPEPGAEEQLMEEQAVRGVVDAMQALTVEERAALLLLHTPNRLPEPDWSEVAHRHPPPPPQRPAEPIERDAIAALLFPNQGPSSGYERVTKLVQRAKKKLRAALVPVSEPSDEEAA